MDKKMRILLVVGVFVMGFVWGVAFEKHYEVKPLQGNVASYEAELEVDKDLELARTHQTETKYDFGEYREFPVQLVVDTDGRIILQLVYSGRNPYVDADINGEFLDYLKKQVETAVAEKKGVRLRNGMTMRFEGYPIWGPHLSSGPNGYARRLYFGQKATFNGQTIVVHGEATKPFGYYPYTF